MDEFEKEILHDFLVEAEGMLESAEQILLGLEDSSDYMTAVDELFRVAHNIKGSSKAVGLEQVGDFTHRYENLLLKLKSGEVKPTTQIVSLLLKGRDCISHMISTLKSDPEANFDNAALSAELDQVMSGEAEETPSDSTPEPTSTSAPDSEGDFDNVEVQNLVDKADAKDAKEVPPDANDLRFDESTEAEPNTETSPQAPQANDVPPVQPVVKHKQASRSRAASDESIRVKLSRIEKLNNVVGELVILHTVLDQRRFVGVKDDNSNKTISQLGKLSKEIQEISMSLRMVPLRQTFQKMSRIVRDTSQALDKKVKLVLKGEDTEIDKTVLEHLGDPLVHIVRNAIDHGLESTEGRVEAGKSETGMVTLKAYHEGSNLVIEATDDGKGIDPEKIKAKAVEKGIIGKDDELEDSEIIQLIFHPGFSTKEQVTDVSGRGVGMDVVKTNIEALSGKVKVNSTLGSGSTFQIVLPLTMAIIEGMVVRSGEQKYVIPLNQIQESILPNQENIHTVTGVGECLNLRGEVIPLADVGKTLGVSKKEDASKKIAIIVRNQECAFAVQVDDILMQQQVVIKTLGDEIRNRKGFMGSSILGDGKPTFILDLQELYQGRIAKSKIKH